MNRKITLLMLAFLQCLCFLCAQSFSNVQTQQENMITTNNKTAKPIYNYESVPGDPIGVKIYTLNNGLKLMMSVNKNEPRIMTNIAIRAGSKQDPKETTGLAHYLEHMLFKGTDKIGALNWEQEKEYLQKISDLYETHRKEKDPEKRKAIYHQIDSVSNEAAKLVAANEYDKIVSNMGAKGTNAYTWVEQTVYVNDIPSNELERWMQLESERFRMVALRLFHTELEAVYEEFNINQDRDYRKVSQAMSVSLFPTHPYGTQTTIGKSEHLKNPSHVNIQNYFKKYYVPNNMAIVLSGDFDPDKVVEYAEKYWGNYIKKTVPLFNYYEQPDITQVIRKEVYGQESPWVQIGWRFNGAATEEPTMLSMVSSILNNQTCGLMDIDLTQQQKVLEASTWAWKYEDFSAFGLSGKPREGQTLEQVEELLLAEIEKLKRGEFGDWLLEAIIKDYKYSQIKQYETNGSRVGSMTNAFILGVDWGRYVKTIDRMKNITKKDIVNFANKYFGNNNYVVVYKRNGEDKTISKVEKPPITPVTLNRATPTAFAEKLMSQKTDDLKPEFIDYKTAIQNSTLNANIPFDYIPNKLNETFALYYIVEMGRAADKKMPLAMSYLPYLGTNKYSPEKLRQELYKLGLDFDVFCDEDRAYVTLTGLNESFEAGVKIFEHILANVKGDQTALDNVVKDILAKRANNKQNKGTILRSAMASYARYGADSPFMDILSEQELKSISPAELADKIKQLTTFEHRVFYYGSMLQEQVKNILNKKHKVKTTLKPVLPPKQYTELETNENKVIFVDFPMVQAEFLMLSKGTPTFDEQEYFISDWYNNYFGSGLSSIVFQEIRESKALAYSANAYYSSPAKKSKAHYLQAYVGTQSDKLKTAVEAMQNIIETMPIAEAQIENARQSILKQIESERITRSSIYWNYRMLQDRGYDYDLRSKEYEFFQKATIDDLKKFQSEHVKGRKFTILVLGSKKNIDMDFLKTLGTVSEMTLEQVFGY